MIYKIDIQIPKDQFSSHMSIEDKTEYIKGKMAKAFGDTFYNEYKMPIIDHNTAEIKHDFILILNVELFYQSVRKLLDDPGLSKKEFSVKFQEILRKI